MATDGGQVDAVAKRPRLMMVVKPEPQDAANIAGNVNANQATYAAELMDKMEDLKKELDALQNPFSAPPVETAAPTSPRSLPSDVSSEVLTQLPPPPDVPPAHLGLGNLEAQQVGLYATQRLAHPDAPVSGTPLPEGMSRHRHLSRQDRATLWAKYQRTLLESTKARLNADKAPQLVVEEIAACEAARQFYFQVWLSCKDWKGVRAFELHFNEKRAGSKKVESWLTDWQMMQVFGCREIVDEMQKWCESQIRPAKARKHPTIPQVAKARQFACVIEDNMREKTEQVLQQGINMEIDLDALTGKDLVRGALARSEEAFGRHGDDRISTLSRSAKMENFDGDDRISTVPPSGPVALDEQKRLEQLRKDENEKREKLQKKEEEKQARIQKRKDDQEQARIDRIAFAATAEGRAKTWLSGLQDVISKLESEVLHCKSDKCHLPTNIAAEYASTFATKAASFKVTRKTIEDVLSGAQPVDDFESMITNAESQVKSLKSEIQRYKTLERGYGKQK